MHSSLGPTGVVLPDLGILGNTHFSMLDLDNGEIADLLSRFLREKGLDRRGKGHKRPSPDVARADD